MASALAHEINNPLGGLFNALSTLKSHGYLPNVRAGSLGLLERGLVGIRDVVRTTLTVYRADTDARSLSPTDIDDIALLVSAEARRKSVVVGVHNTLPHTVELPSTPVRQAVLNLMLNAIAATPAGSNVWLVTREDGHGVGIEVSDLGPGLPPHAADALTSLSNVPPLHDGGGLGLWTVSRLVTDLGGSITVSYPDIGGTSVQLNLPFRREVLSHVA